MSAKVNLTAIAAAATVIITPMLASAMTAPQRKLPPPPPRENTPVVVSPDGRVLGTDPSLAVRFELNRDWAKGR